MAWADETLAVYGDVSSRYERALELTGESATADQQAAITAYIVKAKAYIGRRLDVKLRSLNAERDFSASDLKDLINNPEVFKQAAVAWTLRLLFEDCELNSEDFNHLKMQDFSKEFTEEFDTALALVQYDKDESGDINQTEEAFGMSGNTFYRI